MMRTTVDVPKGVCGKTERFLLALLTSTNKAKEPAAATKPAAAAAPVAAEKPRPTGTSSGATAGAARRGAQGAKDRRGPGAAITLQALLEEEEAGMVQLGDASIASPFTARSTTIGPVEQILQQGRCTLATTMQMYKILALNCLISAYSLSVLYYDGIKLGDTYPPASLSLFPSLSLSLSLRDSVMNSHATARPVR